MKEFVEVMEECSVKRSKDRREMYRGGRADAGCVGTSLHRLCVGSHWNVGEILGLWGSKELNDWHYEVVLVILKPVACGS